jgi:sugar phosphate permease
MQPEQLDNNLIALHAQIPSPQTYAPPSERRMLCLKISMFFLTYFTFSTLHSCRTAWSYSKSSITEDPYYSDDYLGTLDMTFLLFYAIGMYVSGWIGDQINLRIFLTVGLSVSILGLIWIGVMGVTYTHNKGFLSVAFAIYGLGQSAGWPGCIAVMGNWYESKKRGLLFGIWATNQNVGNIIGQQLGSIFIDSEDANWGVVLLTASGWVAFMTIMVFFFLIPSPKLVKGYIPPVAGVPGAAHMNTQRNEIELQIQNSKRKISKKANKEDMDKNFENFEQDISLQDGNKLDSDNPVAEKEKGISFFSAWALPGVAIYVTAFSGVKCAGSGIMFWLPDYLRTIIGFKEETAGLLASYEVGQLLGGIMVGWLSDKLNRRTIVLPGFLLVAVSIFFSLAYLTINDSAKFYVLLFFAGVCLGGPQTIISSAISADLGESIKDASAKSTVTGIIDGTGSLAAAASQKLIPMVKSHVFYLFMAYSLIAGVVLIPVAFKEVKSKIDHGKEKRKMALDMNQRITVNRNLDVIMPDKI